MHFLFICDCLNILFLQSFLVLVALAACVSAQIPDQDAAEQYFVKYGYYPSWYTSATHFAASPATTFKAYPSYAYSYPGYHYGAYPYSYFPGYYATPVAAAEKKVAEEKSAHRVTRSAEEKHDQETAEQYFVKYGYYPSWYNAAHFVAQPYSYVATEKKTETETTAAEKTAVEAKYYPSYYQTYSGYGFAAPAVYKAGEKYVTPAAAVPYYPYNGNYHYGAQYFY